MLETPNLANYVGSDHVGSGELQFFFLNILMATYTTYVSEPGIFSILLKQCKGILAH